LEDGGYPDSTAALNRPALPASAVVIGGGPRGLELAQLFRRSGVRTAIVEAGHNCCGRGRGIGEALAGDREDEGIQADAGIRITHVPKTSSGKAVCGEVQRTPVPYEGSGILVATGRSPNPRGPEVEEAGVQVGSAARSSSMNRGRR
jgi:pyruvate/2-oxoglutarate dehydrogenase complex dihydrolipoamide dehydrogenase (E3) component